MDNLNNGAAMDYEPMRRNGLHWEIRAPLAGEPAFCDLLDRVSAESPQDREEVQRRRGHHSWFERGGADGECYFIKRYYPRNRLNGLQYCFRQNRARREFEAALRMQRAGLPVPAPLALGERRVAGFWHSSVLVCRGFDGAVSLKQVDWNDAGVRGRCRHLAADIAAMHEQGICHGDLHSGNVLYVAGRGCLLTDFDKARFQRPLPQALWVDDLARFNAHIDADINLRMTFFRIYCRQRRLRRLHHWYEQVNRRSEYLWRKYERKHGVDVTKYRLDW